MTDSDKRSYQRYRIWFPVTLLVDRKQVWAICRDASVGGALLSVVTPVPVGTHLQARFKVSPRSRRERTVAAIVVRQEASVGEMMLAFPYRAALEFTEPVQGLLDELARFTDTRVG
jgi:hypothetical protein